MDFNPNAKFNNTNTNHNNNNSCISAVGVAEKKNSRSYNSRVKKLKNIYELTQCPTQGVVSIMFYKT